MSFFSQKSKKQDGAKRTLSNSGLDIDGSKKKLPERGIYTPPSGKYSTNTNNGNGNGKRRTFSTGANRSGGANNRGGRF